MEKLAAKAILDNIKKSFGARAGLVGRIATFAEDTGLPPNLANFVGYYHLDVRAIYGKYSFSRLCVDAGVKEDYTEPVEESLTKAFSRLCAVDSRRWIGFLLDLLPRLDGIDFSALAPVEQRMMQMFYVTVWGKAIENMDDGEVRNNLQSLAVSPIMLGELLELLQYNYDHIDFIDHPMELGFDCPLDVHCTYTHD